MTGFGPGGLDCDEVLADVYLYLDDESDLDVRQRIRTHLDDCAPCLRRFGLEQDVKSLVARSCGGDRAPSNLKDRIRGRLTQVVIETTHLEYRAE
ncbi:MAG: mycothiol system anti-sigma-R factor [Actinomycetota bacterium]|nr:mycothiol system anti-sigma-R factor [Actinomycetota bacterium]MDQ2958371.1 mycothiol system anti-sigma-R factor [Actinomycetota bacterium]